MITREGELCGIERRKCGRGGRKAEDEAERLEGGEWTTGVACRGERFSLAALNFLNACLAHRGNTSFASDLTEWLVGPSKGVMVPDGGMHIGCVE